MSPPLVAALGIDREGLEKRFLAVNEFHGSNANFIIANLMSDSLKRGHGVCLISLHNPISHYHHVLIKMSAINLSDLKERKNQIETVDLMNDFREHMYCGDQCSHGFWDSNNKFSVQKLFFVIKDKIKKLLETQSSVCVVFDDVSHLLDVGVSLKDVLSLIQYCRTFLTLFTDVSLVALSHVVSEDDTNVLASNIAHVADIVVNVSILKTGHSNDVSGVLEIRSKISNTLHTQWNAPSIFHFKLMDRHVKLYAPGTSMFGT